MTLFLLILFGMMVVSGLIVLSAAMLSSQVSQQEEGRSAWNEPAALSENKRLPHVPAAVPERIQIQNQQRQRSY